MRISISKNDTLDSIQKKFQSSYPFLMLEFFKTKGEGRASRERLPASLVVQYAGDLHSHIWISIKGNRTVGKLEDDFCRKTGLNVQVMRRSGNLWIETTKTDSWTLEKQNDEGRSSRAVAVAYETPYDDLMDIS